MKFSHVYMLLTCFSISLIHGCIAPPKFDDVPRLTNVSVNKNSFNQSAGFTTEADSLVISIGFEDGDGDIGRSFEDTIPTIALLDSRFAHLGIELTNYKIPIIPSNGSTADISGTLRLTAINNFNCRSDSMAIDTFSYLIYIIDRAGNESNRIRTPVISVTCD